jgi:hypothetical protein
MDARIQRTVQHYMTEIQKVGGRKPVMELNREVVKEASASVDAWLKKQEPPAVTTLGAFARPDEYNRLFEDTQQRYESLMADRTPPAMPVPPMPDFSMKVGEKERLEDPVLLMQRGRPSDGRLALLATLTLLGCAKKEAPKADVSAPRQDAAPSRDAASRACSAARLCAKPPT